MNREKVIAELKQKYSGKKIIFNDKDNPTEIICEIDPSSQHPENSVAIAVIDKFKAHYHKKSTETFEVLSGELLLRVDDQEHKLKERDSFTILPGGIHSAIGSETWTKVYSSPGWMPEDSFLAEV